MKVNRSVPPPTVVPVLVFGHSSPRAAMIYRHATSERDRRIAERLAEVADEERRRARPVEAVPTGGGVIPVGHGWGTTARRNTLRPGPWNEKNRP